MKLKIFRALVAVVLVLTLIVNLSPIRAQALQLGLVARAAVVGVGALLAIGTILIGNGVGPGESSTDFWSLCRTIYNQLPSSYKVMSSATNELLLKAVQSGGRLGVSRDLVEAVNNFVFTGTLNAVVSNATKIPTVVKTPTFSVPSVKYEDALQYLLDNRSPAYQMIMGETYDCCTRIGFSDGSYMYVWSGDKISETSAGALSIPIDAIGVLITSAGMSYSTVAPTGTHWTTYESVKMTFKPTKDLYVHGSAAEKLDTSRWQVIEGTGGNGGQDVDGDGKNDTIVALRLLATMALVEQLTPDEATDATKAPQPDIVVDPTTDKIIMESGETKWIYGREVSIDAVTGVASMLIAMGISPGVARDDFKALVSQIVDELPSSLITNYESVLNGSYPLMPAWQFNGKYYLMASTMQLVMDLLFEGSATMDPIFEPGVLSPDLAQWPEFTSHVPVSYRESDVYNYLVCIRHSTPSGVDLIFALSGNPIRVSPSSYITFSSVGPARSWRNGASKGIWADGQSCSIASLYVGSGYSVAYDLFQRSLAITGDFSVPNVQQDLSKLEYQSITVNKGNAEIKLYPVTLYSTIDSTINAGQTGVQSGTGSDPSLVVDPTTNEVIAGGVVNPPSDVVPEETLPPVVVPDVPGADVDNPGTDSGSDAGTGSATSTFSFKGLLSTLYEWGAWLVECLTSPFVWLGNFLSSVWKSVISGQTSTLLNGLEILTTWLKAGIVDGVGGVLRELFVPPDDLLATKVEDLRSRFSFVDGVFVSVSALLSMFAYENTSSPPKIYLNLSNAPSGIWGSGSVVLIDFSFYEPYKKTTDALISGAMWAFFIWRVFMRLPAIIGGESGYIYEVVAHDDKQRRLSSRPTKDKR